MSVYTVEAPPTSKMDLERIGERVLEVVAPGLLAFPGATDVGSLIDRDLARLYPEWSLSVEPQTPSNVEAYSDFAGKKVVVSEEMYERLLNDETRERFTGAHEFSHVVLHRTMMSGVMMNFKPSEKHLFRKEKSQVPAYKDPEWQANYLASVILMPRVHVLKIIETKRHSLNIIHEMMNVFKVSYSAAQVRLKNVRGF